jgi:hypothetical protein
MEYYEEQGWPKEGHPSHVPVAVPAYGSYGDWIVARGIHTNKTTWPPLEVGPFTVYGLWINDPNPNGYGDKTYITAQTFLTDFLQPINDPTDRWYGKYLALIEPPQFINENDVYTNANIDIEIAENIEGFSPAEKKLLRFNQKINGNTFSKILVNKIIAETAYEKVEEVVRYDEQYLHWLSETELETVHYDKESYTVIFSGKENSFEVIIGALRGELKSFTIFYEFKT